MFVQSVIPELLKNLWMSNFCFLDICMLEVSYALQGTWRRGILGSKLNAIAVIKMFSTYNTNWFTRETSIPTTSWFKAGMENCSNSHARTRPSITKLLIKMILLLIYSANTLTSKTYLLGFPGQKEGWRNSHSPLQRNSWYSHCCLCSWRLSR